MRAGKRMLIQAPSGSGKTVLCVKVVAELLAEKVATQTSPLFPAPAPGPGEEVVLLLGHSVALVQQMTAELVAELEHRTGVTVQREPLDGCPVGHGVLVHVVGCPKVAVHVLTVDELVDADRNHAATYLGAVEPLKYAAAVVDEGHLVFSHQPYAWLDGQHRCKASEVRWVLERRLAVAGAAVVVFHDTSYQHVAAEPPEYPERCFRSIVPLPIVRNPGPVRDCSVPFCEELQTSNDSGRAKLFPLLEECIEEVSASRGGDDEMAVRMVDVRWGCDGYKGKKTLSTVLYNRAKKERQGDNRDGTEAVSREQSTNYAGVIVRELDRIRDDWADWERSVAVLVPGSPEGLPAELLAAAVVVADSKPELAVVAAALRRVEVSVVNDGTLYFGAVENFAGLERPVVVVSGMRHPRYVAHRVQHERWTATSGRVDARVYLAVTRCTVYLVVAEMEAKTFAAHYGVSAVARQGGGPAQLRGEWTRDKIEEASQVYLEPLNRGPDGRGFWTIRLQVTVDLDAPPAPRDLATAVSVQLRVGNRPHMLDRTKWDETSFLWEHCASGIRELDVVEQLGPNLANEAGLVYLGVCDLADLAVLTLSKNAIESVPAEIGQLTGLRRLVLSENNLRSMPATVGRLTALTELNLNDNELESLPVEIGNLVALTLLRLDNNQLTNVPKELGQLVALTQLALNNNQLERVPPELGDLVALTAVRLDHNRLSKVPDQLGNLVALTALRLDDNQLTSVPKQLGDLPVLKFLHLDRNKLTSLPAELGNLAALISLTADCNMLTSVPEELGLLKALTSLGLGQNQLEFLPKALWRLTGLIALKLDQNKLANVPTDIQHLTSLTYLTLQKNQLKCVPAELGQLVGLTNLYLYENQLTDVPAELGQLTSLTHVRLHENRLVTLPPSFGALAKLKHFVIDDHVAADRDSESAMRQLEAHGVVITRHPTKRDTSDVDRLKTFSRMKKRSQATRAVRGSASAAHTDVDPRSIDELLSEMGEDMAAGASGPAATGRGHRGSGSKGPKGARKSGPGKKKKR
eukprot:m.375890 g.375890  ORF g.375890 m.375890 type:complete len:1033 (+) comp28188_c3_seq1:1151-4249(+)